MSQESNMTDLTFIASKGFSFTPIYDGVIHRDDSAGRAQWFIGHLLPGGATILHFGDWRTSEKYTHYSRDLSPDEIRNFERLTEKKKAELIKEQCDIADIVAEELRELTEPRDTPLYIKAKGLELWRGVRVLPKSPHAVCVPLRDTTGKYWNYQLIHPDGTKEFVKGAKLTGLFHALTSPDEVLTIIIAEGYATAASIALALPEDDSSTLVVSAMSATNLRPAAEGLRERFPGASIIIAADRDKPWEDNKSTTGANTGLVLARRAAEVVGAEIAIPPAGRDRKAVDWNDIYVSQGAEKVKSLLIPKKVSTKPQSKPKVSDEKVASVLVESFKSDYVVLGNSQRFHSRQYFKWSGTHWQEVKSQEMYSLMYPIVSEMHKGSASYNATMASMNMACEQLKAPVDEGRMLSCHNFKFNFLDCTVEVRRHPDGKYELAPMPHDKSDWICYRHQWNWNTNDTLPRDGTFAQFLKLREQDAGGGQVRAIKQMLAACLVPYFPRFFFLVGQSDSGKSTLAILAGKLAGQENCSSLSPSDWKGFMTSHMAGKLVNIETDLSYQQPINDDIIKKVRDRVPILMDRKGVHAIRATLPPVHIFCANRMPKTLEGNTGALDKRITILPIKRVPWDVKDPANYIWTRDAGGVLDAAKEGLKDLIESDFEYFVPPESKSVVAEWQEENDPVAMFISDMKAGDQTVGCNIELNGQAESKASEVYKAFKEWAEENRIGVRLGSRTFYRDLKRLGFVMRHTRTGTVVAGFTEKSQYHA